MRNLFGTSRLKRLRLMLFGLQMVCGRCKASVRLPVRKFGTMLDISGPEVRGWTFTTARGWNCAGCSAEPAQEVA